VSFSVLFPRRKQFYVSPLGSYTNILDFRSASKTQTL